MGRRMHLKTSPAAAVALLVLALAVLQAQQPPPPQPQPPQPAEKPQQPQPPAPAGQPQNPATAQPPAAPATPAKALVPVAASTLATTPDPYIGEIVSLAGALEQNVSKTAFSVDQDRSKSTGKEVLVIVPTLQHQVDPNTYITVIGEVVRFDAAALAAKLKDYKLDLPPDVAAKFAGKPAIIATNVIDPAGNDAARRLPPPMSAEEEAYSKIMKQVGTSNGALRKAIEGSDAKLAADNTAALRKAFVEVETFWKNKRRNDAAEWARDARKLSENIERAAAAGRWDDVKAHAGTLGKSCQACHGVYRERFDDGSYRIKMKNGTE